MHNPEISTSISIAVSRHRSDLTQRAFCEQAGIPLSTLQWWLVQGRRAAARPTRAVAFAEIVAPACADAARDAQPAWAMEIATAHGLTVRLRSPLAPTVLARVPRDVRRAMLSLSPATSVFVALGPVDMRKSFNGLPAAAETVMAQDIASGHLSLFTNRLKTRVKALYWDGSGLVLYTKRLERGRFGWPIGDGPSRRLRPEGLTLLLHGLEGHPRAHWYRR